MTTGLLYNGLLVPPSLNKVECFIYFPLFVCFALFSLRLTLPHQETSDICFNEEADENENNHGDAIPERDTRSQFKERVTSCPG